MATCLLLQGNTQFQQAAALGPNGLTIGPNKVNAPDNEQERQAQGNLGIQDLKIGKDGLIVNDGSRLNSSVLASLPYMAPGVARAANWTCFGCMVMLAILLMHHFGDSVHRSSSSSSFQCCSH